MRLQESGENGESKKGESSISISHVNTFQATAKLNSPAS